MNINMSMIWQRYFWIIDCLKWCEYCFFWTYMSWCTGVYYPTWGRLLGIRDKDGKTGTWRQSVICATLCIILSIEHGEMLNKHGHQLIHLIFVQIVKHIWIWIWIWIHSILNLLIWNLIDTRSGYLIRGWISMLETRWIAMYLVAYLNCVAMYITWCTIGSAFMKFLPVMNVVWFLRLLTFGLKAIPSLWTLFWDVLPMALDAPLAQPMQTHD